MSIKGLLSDCFLKVASKKLSAVEANPAKSNQHEFNGSEALKRLLGSEDQRKIEARAFFGLTESNRDSRIS